MKILDIDGNERTLPWLAEMFGPVQVFPGSETDGSKRFQIVCLQERHLRVDRKTGRNILPGQLSSTILDAAGNGVEGLVVKLAKLEDLADFYESTTDANGMAFHELTEEYWYAVSETERGHYALHCGVKNDGLVAMGLVRAKPGRWLDVTWRMGGEAEEPEPEPEPEPQPTNEVLVYDAHGNQKDWEWLTENFGAIEILENGGERFKVKSLSEDPTGDMAVTTVVLDANGNPLINTQVVWWYSTAPQQSGIGWLEQGEIFATGAGGAIDLIMSRDGWYAPPAGGPYGIWLAGEGKSQMISGVGWVTPSEPDQGSHRHLHVVFQAVDGETPDENWETLFAKLDKIIELLTAG